MEQYPSLGHRLNVFFRNDFLGSVFQAASTEFRATSQFLVCWQVSEVQNQLESRAVRWCERVKLGTITSVVSSLERWLG